MKKISIIFFCLISLIAIAQKKKSTTLGKTTLTELKMTVYEKDSSAVALVLSEHGNLYVNPLRDFQFTTDYYFRVKILKKEGFEKTTVKIPVFGKGVIHDIKAITYNQSEENHIVKNYLLKENIYTNQVNEKWKEVSFTLSNIKVGSVVEYTYSLTSPYRQIDDWDFQSDIPKIKSDFTAAIMGNWQYNIRIVGFLKLDRENPSVKKNCVYVPGIGNGSCSILEFGMDSVPALKEEKYMLSKRNYMSRVVFDLKSFTNINGDVTNYTKTWKDAEKKLKYNFLDNQSSKKKYFRKNVLNDSILLLQDKLEKAKKIYTLIKEHYTWNEKFWPAKKVKIKKAYQSKTGNIFDINLSLYNALQAGGIESKLTMLATRDKGLPTKLYPIINDFNYLVVRVVVANKVYFLDASRKNMPFGLIQFDALNGDGRVMDFKKDSFWEEIQVSEQTTKNTKLMLTYDGAGFKGNLMINSTGYEAFNQRERLTQVKEEVFLENFETKHPNIEVEKFKTRNLNKLDKKLQEMYQVSIVHDFKGERNIKINPFFIDKRKENPFKLSERTFPVDFGYPRSNTYILSLSIPDGYLVKKLPESKSLGLPNKGGRIIFNVRQEGNIINVYFKKVIKNKEYTSDAYFYLKEFYNQLIKIQDSFIVLEKI